MASRLDRLADLVQIALDKPAPNETIQLCGLSALSIIVSQPTDALALARQHLQASTRSPLHWRRLFEDASLSTFISEVRFASEETKNDDGDVPIDHRLDLLAKCVKHVDGAIIVAGAPGRRSLIDNVLQQLDFIAGELTDSKSEKLLLRPPAPLETEFAIRRVEPMSFTEFQYHLDHSGEPIIIPRTFDHWPARTSWGDLQYLRQKTLHGLRIVPVELGDSYVDSAWSQAFMSFNEFADRFLLPTEPESHGYLAMHDIFAQIPALRNDIAIPDLCYTEPKPPSGAALETAGLADTQILEMPETNVWLGPRGTKTPLHTDPYHNVFCQIVGWKYVRLYPPEERERLYAHDHDTKMGNTSRIDISKHRMEVEMPLPKDTERRGEIEQFPLFECAEYREAIVGPGDALYVPLGWWHYVESLSTSISVSFWWN